MPPLIPTLMLLASAPASEQLPASSTDTLAAGDHSTRPEVARTCDLVVTFTEEVGKSAAQPAPSFVTPINAGPVLPPLQPIQRPLPPAAVPAPLGQ